MGMRTTPRYPLASVEDLRELLSEEEERIDRLMYTRAVSEEAQKRRDRELREARLRESELLAELALVAGNRDAEESQDTQATKGALSSEGA